MLVCHTQFGGLDFIEFDAKICTKKRRDLCRALETVFQRRPSLMSE